MGLPLFVILWVGVTKLVISEGLLLVIHPHQLMLVLLVVVILSC
jgi:hypothetical protein